ncbi:hypothetical protein Pmi06nite_64810 [Planotetraspora mira]|uniref:Uncharacterized protein n=1 Tax=Planotetraspora mira TaxID=58121 RepID=A0A8J3TVF6_9ACTN|nr:hypothetical protein Pmi06nite_64810 [Planotetraspora mira]
MPGLRQLGSLTKLCAFTVSSTALNKSRTNQQINNPQWPNRYKIPAPSAAALRVSTPDLIQSGTSRDGISVKRDALRPAAATARSATRSTVPPSGSPGGQIQEAVPPPAPASAALGPPATPHRPPSPARRQAQEADEGSSVRAWVTVAVGLFGPPSGPDQIDREDSGPS